MEFHKNKKIKKKFNMSIQNAKEIISMYPQISLDSLDHPIYRVIHIFARSMQARFLQEVITTHEYEISQDRNRNLFHPPYKLLKENNIPFLIHETSEANKEVILDFSKDLIFSFPWSIKRFKSALKNINRENWTYDILNHRAYYIEPFKIGYMYNGLHSSSIGIVFNSGEMPARTIDMSSLYDWVSSDGINYYNKKTNKKISKVPCFEEAIIYEIGRLIVESK